MARDYVLAPFRPPVELQIDYARELNPQQLAAVTAPPGPALVLAGAGAGKTRTLTYRVAYLLEHGVPPECVLLLTFTNKAAREMMRRVADLLAHDTAALWGGTFHAVGLRLLRRHARLLGYAPDFTVLDRADAEDVLGACLGAREDSPDAKLWPTKEVLAELFSLAANTRQPLPALVEQRFRHLLAPVAELEAVRAAYVARKRELGVMDFDDLLVLWLRLLEEHEPLREHYQRRFQFILVDEYQDTNQLQSDLIDLLAARHHGVMAVGDDAQSIYSWRGANYRNILHFCDRHPTAQVFKIETNYRSTPEVLAVANAAIALNQHQHFKELRPVRPSGPKPGLVVCGDAGIQAAFVGQRVCELHEEGVPLREIVVLYRSHFHALEVQLELRKRGVPFSITSGMRLFEQAHIKDLVAYLRLVCNPRDELAFKRLARMLRGIGPKAADRLWNGYLPGCPAPPPPVALPGDETADGDPDWSVSPPRSESPPKPAVGKPVLAVALQAVAGLVPKKAAVAWAQLSATMAQLEEARRVGGVAELVRLAIEADYEDYLERTYENARSRLEDLEQLAGFASQFESPEDFLSQMALWSQVEAEGDYGRAYDEDRVCLSTVHQAKGLEFQAVFVIMLCEGMFPSRRAAETPEGEEEERRLFYVAITRAKDEVYLCHPLLRLLRSSGSESFQQASRFLASLPPELLEPFNLVPPFNAYAAPGRRDPSTR